MMVVAIVQLATRALGILFVMCSVSGAQQSSIRERIPIFGATASGFITPYLREDNGAIGALVGLEQRLADGISIRALASVQRAFRSNSIGICIPDGESGCLEVLLPYWLSTVEANALVKPYPVPIRVVVGVGYAIGSDPRGTRSGAPNNSLPLEAGFVIRRGLEISLGRSPRAPRLQYTHSDVRPDPFSLKRVEALTLLLVR